MIEYQNQNVVCYTLNNIVYLHIHCTVIGRSLDRKLLAISIIFRGTSYSREKAVELQQLFGYKVTHDFKTCTGISYKLHS